MKLPDHVWHYVKQNEASRYPRRIVCLDSESLRAADERGEAHSFLLGVASFDQIDRTTRCTRKTQWVETDSPADLWEWISSHVRSRERTCLFAHNLAYDLRVSQAFTVLPALGWHLKFISLDTRRCYVRWQRGDASLSCSDTTSYFPVSLDRIGQELGLRKTQLPAIGEPPDKFYDRCRQDVVILRESVLTLLGWLEGNDSGNFKPTGPAQAWTTYRHRFMNSRSILVHREEEALAAERESAHTGRVEAWKHGEYHYPLEEYDYRLAYATLAADWDMPCRYLGSQQVGRQLDTALKADGTLSLYDCTVTTDLPLVPCRQDGRIMWPTGTFRTHLWDCEADLVIANGGTVTADRCWRYLKAPVLREWGEWIIRSLSDESLEIPGLIRIMLKHWARCLIGRFGMRYPEWEYVGKSPDHSLTHFECYELGTGEQSEYLQIADDWYTCNGRRDGFDTAPAIMAYIVALQRVKMWHAIEAAGPSEVFYMDTDSLLTTPAGGRNLQELSKQIGHGNLIRKHEYQSVEIFGPRCLVLDGEPRIAGLPRRATKDGKRTFKAEAWQSLGDSLKQGTPNTVRVSPRTFTIAANDSRRKHLANGHTAPFAVTL